MRKAVNYIVAADLLFVFILAISGLLSGIAGDFVYYLSFIIPTVIFVLVARREKLESVPLKLKISKEDVILLIPAIAPALAVIFLLSWLTSLLLAPFGSGNSVDTSGNIFQLVLLHAIAPAILEEGLFRYIPIKYLSPISSKWAVIISAACFSAAHLSFYQIPYAFAAGIIFAVIDIMSGSILPSVIFHFLNNTVSLIWLKYAGSGKLYLVFLLLLFVLAIASFVILLLKRKLYRKKLAEIFLSESKQKLAFSFLFFVALALIMAAFNL